MKNEVRYPEYRDDPAGFVENVLGAAGEPYSKQREMLEAVAGSRRVSVVGANGCGKGWALARLILWWVETRARRRSSCYRPPSARCARSSGRNSPQS